TVITGLKKKSCRVLVVEQTTASTPIGIFKPEAGISYCLVFGNEINGVSDEVVALADGALEIPQSGTKHSLNVSVCIGIVSWWITQNLKR
ncbi:MAG TPA: TrmH family RNA methyltransferase, partial [Cyclobacteriaceae bacterium]|nr:TrmH family RNA methyltransferase [Cyclobacteriaceae bacterium]